MRRCRVCEHPKRQEIDALLLAGQNGTKVAEAFGIPTSTLYRHRGKCLKPSEIPPDLSPGEEIAESYRELQELALCAVRDARKEPDPKKRAEALRVYRQVLSDLQKMTVGTSSSTEPLHRSEEWRTLRTLLLDALRPHAAARRDVVAVLKAWEGGEFCVIPRS